MEAKFLVRQFATGGDRNFGYLVADLEAEVGAFIDPSPSPDAMAAVAEDEDLRIPLIFTTHSHMDHTMGLSRAATLTGARILALGDLEGTTGTRVEHGSVFSVGTLDITILHTPGHTEDSICLLAGEALFAGDTLFVGKIGGSEMGGDARAQYRSLHDILLKLPDTTLVFPGHDYGAAPESTIGEERRNNPFLIQPDLKAFLNLKRNWGAYKRKHGIR